MNAMGWRRCLGIKRFFEKRNSHSTHSAHPLKTGYSPWSKLEHVRKQRQPNTDDFVVFRQFIDRAINEPFVSIR